MFVKPVGSDQVDGALNLLISYRADNATLFSDYDSPEPSVSNDSDKTGWQDEQESDDPYRYVDENGYARSNNPIFNPPPPFNPRSIELMYPFPSVVKAAVPRKHTLSDDIPLNAHILAGSGYCSHVTFPVICVADSNDIISLIASVAHQRKVWGLNDPVIGLEISEYGRLARLHIGWLDTANSISDSHLVRRCS